ncbi:hypothetical protein TWF730_003989 [Orbilia blumenaviensis]|uniref:PLAC8 family-domain-containing protein n=1 Tax=Orbilia blumenaviensis TaxID=1796055 RepID=A0AAV9U319_9PEZI
MVKIEAPEPTMSANQQGFYQIPLNPQPGVPTLQKPMAPNEWIYGMCGCFEDADKCCIGLCCPCITYGEIAHRMRGKRTADYNRCCNGPCWGFFSLMFCGASWVMGMMQRGEARRKYNMEGTGCGDCMRHFFCECCTLIQEHREIETRNQLLVPANSFGYQPVAAMSYSQINGVSSK